MKREYFIGIDFGHGETTVSRVPGYKGQPVSQMKLRCTTTDAEKKVFSAICKRGNKWSLVYGENDFTSQDLREGFKGSVDEMSDKDKESFKEFSKLIFAEILNNDDKLKYEPNGERNFELWIACPSGWTREDPMAATKYTEFFRNECGLPIDGCVKESDAAFFSKFSEYENYDSVFVIDLGSSTVDYTTYAHSRMIGDCCWGECLGAHLIDDMLLSYILSNKKHKENLIEIDRLRKEHSWRGDIDKAMSLFVRLNKEKHYVNKADGFSFAIFFKDLCPLLDDNMLFLPCVSCVLNEESYVKLINDYQNQLLESFRNAALLLEKYDIKPAKVLLSGGASQMPFVKEFAESVFGKVVDKDDTPECVVSNGIALYANKLEECVEKLKAKFRNVDLRSLYIEADKKAMTDSAQSLLPEVISKIKSSSCSTGNDIRKLVCSFLSNLDSSNQKFADSFKCSLRKGLSEKIQAAIEDTIKEVFHVKVTASARISVKNTPILSSPKSIFEPGGAMYNLIGRWIVNSYAPTFKFNWEIERDHADRVKIATGMKNYISAFIMSDKFLSYDDLSIIMNDITSQAEEQLINTFYRSQVFETIYKSSYGTEAQNKEIR